MSFHLKNVTATFLFYTYLTIHLVSSWLGLVS